jgi:hypothetical protein
MPRPDKCGAIDRQRFKAAYAMMTEAIDRPLPAAVQDEPLWVEVAPGHVKELYLTDHPVNRMMFAAQEYFADDEETWLTFMCRVSALMRLMQQGVLAAWVEPTEDGSAPEVEDAVLYAAADVPLNKNGIFPRQVFLQRVWQLASEG